MNSIVFTSPQYEISQTDFAESRVSHLENVDSLNIDDWITQTITDKLDKDPYTNIIIPLSFGQSAIEFLGLRFAMHIRTQIDCKNQCANIFIYGTEPIVSLIDHDLFSIMTTKGVKLIDYNLFQIKEYAQTTKKILTNEQLPFELRKIHLSVPTNLYDNHSIANIWGMYRLLELDGINYDQVDSLKTKKNSLNNLYFKWLLAQHEDEKLVTEEVKASRYKYIQQSPELKILGKIDLPNETKKHKRV
jgi:hypothetical protein